MSASGGSLLNRAINAFPFELHIPGYQFCDPGNRLMQHAMKAKTKIGMSMKSKKSTRKKTTKKTDTTDGVRKAVNHDKATRPFSSRSCNVTIARWNRVADCISFRTNTDADCISVPTNADRA
ncbi:hypothetical protein ALC56_03929 [Trachymyrmex septentrionalis]|uniref:Uncharacterized protein n=1 Tax=Trachymyrmex septentrionalis TaxID=34720 RepID=A0A151JYZ9_9HYME|nr:hypothetical protein ALC56_03929 [Trachymyrmex septentrionalis]